MHRTYEHAVYELNAKHILHEITMILYTIRLIIYWFDSIFYFQSIRRVLLVAGSVDTEAGNAIRQCCHSPPSEVIETDCF